MITILGRLKLLNLGFSPIREPIREAEAPESWLEHASEELARAIDRNILEEIMRLGEERRNREGVIQPIHIPQSPFQPFQPFQPFNPYQPYQPQQPYTTPLTVPNPYQPQQPYITPWTVPNPYSPWTGDPMPDHRPYVGDPQPYHQPWTIMYSTSTKMKSADEVDINIYCNAVSNNLNSYARSNAK
jgi:hypothetical protein